MVESGQHEPWQTLAGCQLRTLELKKPLCSPGVSLCHLKGV